MQVLKFSANLSLVNLIKIRKIFGRQPEFKQILNLINQVNIKGLIYKHQINRYYKAFKIWTLCVLHIMLGSRLNARQTAFLLGCCFEDAARFNGLVNSISPPPNTPQ